MRERFAWNEESSLHVALVRVSKLPQPWIFPYERGYGGCRSWVKLPGEGAARESDCRRSWMTRHGMMQPHGCERRWKVRGRTARKKRIMWCLSNLQDDTLSVIAHE